MTEEKIKKIVCRRTRQTTEEISFFLDSNVAVYIEEEIDRKYGVQVEITQEMLNDIGNVFCFYCDFPEFTWDRVLRGQVYYDAEEEPMWLSTFIFEWIDDHLECGDLDIINNAYTSCDCYLEQTCLEW